MSTQPATAPGEGYVVQAHAPLFRRADFRSRRLRLLQADEPVTLLRTLPGYHYVQTRQGKGYLPHGLKAASDRYVDAGQ